MLVNLKPQQISKYKNCDAKKSVSVKEYKPNKKQKQFLQITKTCICIIKTVKKTQVTRFQKTSPDFKE